MKILLLLALIAALVTGLAFAGGRAERKSVQGGAGTTVAPTPPPAPQDWQSNEPLSSEGLRAIIAENDSNTFLVDVRTPEEYRAGAIPSAINIPYDVIQGNLPTEDRSARIIVYCRSGNRSGIAARTLAQLGFQNVLDFGAVSRWSGELVRR